VVAAGENEELTDQLAANTFVSGSSLIEVASIPQ